MEWVGLVQMMVGSGDDSLLVKIVVAVVVYFVARKEVRAQFTGVTKELSEIKTALQAFGQKLTELESAHNARLVKVEAEVVHIKKDLKDIKDSLIRP